MEKLDAVLCAAASPLMPNDAARDAAATRADASVPALASLLPVDSLVAAYNLLLAVVWASLTTRVSYAPWLCAVHLVAASLPIALRQCPRPRWRVTACLREYYPLLWLVGFWTELGYLLPLLHPRFFDAAVERLDVTLFGASWSTKWMERAPSLWVSEPMHLLYMLFFPVVAVPPLAFGLTGRRDALRDVTFRLALAYLGCCLVYLLVPVAGPVRDAPAGAALTRGICYRLIGLYWRIGNSLGTAFPSFHVAAAVTVVFVAWRWMGRALAWAMTALAVGLALSTVYTRHHYTIDAAAGALLAVVLQALVAPLLQRRPALGRHP